MTSQLKVVEKTGVPGIKHHLTSCHWQFLTCPGQDSNLSNGERQCAVSGNAFWPLSHWGRPSVMRDSAQSVAMPLTTQSSQRDSASQWQCLLTTQPLGQALSGKRQRSVSGNAFDHSVIGEGQRAVSDNAFDNSAIGAGPHWWETSSIQWQCLWPLSHRGMPNSRAGSKLQYYNVYHF